MGVKDAPIKWENVRIEHRNGCLAARFSTRLARNSLSPAGEDGLKMELNNVCCTNISKKLTILIIQSSHFSDFSRDVF